nr:protein kinase [Kineosporia babensis]
MSGGEGDIWRARYRGELTSPLPVAVKRLRRPANVGDDWPTPADLRRWEDLRALLLIMRIDHLVSVLDVFVGPAPHPHGLVPEQEAPITPYVVMEWVPGPTLADEYTGRPATAENLGLRLRQVEQVAKALNALHSRTVSAGNPSLHRDVKPTNCILAPLRGVVLVDVGTMRRVDDGRDLSGRHTPAYTAPEVLTDPMAAREAASDRYSLGALAWFCVTGQNPPPARDPQAQEQARSLALEAARNAGVRDPAAFATHLTQMLAPQPTARPTDAQAWAERLRTLGVISEPTSKSLLAAAIAIPLMAIALILLPLAVPREEGEPSASSTKATLPASIVTEPPPPHRNLDRGPWPTRGTTSKSAAFTAPADGAEIGRCPQLRGTADLPPGRTLLFTVENLSVGERIRHVTLIPGWRRPASLARWKLRPPVGLPSDPLGDRYRLEVVVVPLAALKGQAATRSGLAIPAKSYVGASIFVSRGNQSDKGCPTGPPPAGGPPPRP